MIDPLKLVPGWAWLLALGVATTVAVALQLTLANERADHARTQAQHARQLQQLAESARDTTAKWLQAYAAHSKQLQELSDANRSEQARHARTAAALRADNGQLRDAIASYAARRGDPAADTVAACQARADRLGSLLVESLQLQVEVTGAAEHHAADARTLYDGWRRLAEVTP